MATDVIYATDLYSGYNIGFSATYATARSTYNSTVNSTSSDIGQETGYLVYEAPLMFDTSAIGADTISSALLSLWLFSDLSTTDFVVQARVISAYGSRAAAWVAGASLSGLTLLAHIDTNGIGATGAYKVLTNDAMPASINGSGTTYMLLSSANQAAGTAPTAKEYILVYNANQTGTTSDPKLTITHTAPAHAGLASGTGAAQAPAPSVSAAAGLAVGVGASLAPAVSVAASAGVAQGTGAANSAIVSESEFGYPDVAAGTGAALNAAVAVFANAGIAAGTGAAFGPSTALGPMVAAATGTGTAWDATTIGATVLPIVLPAGGRRRRPITRVARPAMRLIPVVYALAGVAQGAGSAFDADTEIEWTTDEWLLGLSDEQLMGAA